MQLACTSASQESFIGSRTGIVFDGTLGTKRLLLLISNSIENSSSSGMQSAILVPLHTAAAALVVVMLKHSAFCTFWLRGFGTVVTGAIPARIIFLTALETTKVASFKMMEPFKLSEPTQAAIANGMAGMLGFLCSQAVFVPIDVISQRLMMQGYSGHATSNGGLDVARKILKSDGIRGFYRGFGLSVMTYSPSSAVWWASYGSSQRLIWSLLHYGTEHDGPAPTQGTIMLVQAGGGIFAGATASCITTPLDTIKTRLQLLFDHVIMAA
ncbi:unnamed protein product [Fraxinus pennsylvanica]|uniref:Solute carrier family 25 member 44 n=1 Tax=Fraxinus pennsylvanica TaxID=56036 RepID=A0AAD2DLT5_9LAMI|nr:unnamed protein product [Fraxinus pennsylvanica]